MKLQSIERSSIDRGFRKADPLIAKFRGNAQDIPGGRRKGEEHWMGGGEGEGSMENGTRADWSDLASSGQILRGYTAL